MISCVRIHIISLIQDYNRKNIIIFLFVVQSFDNFFRLLLERVFYLLLINASQNLISSLFPNNSFYGINWIKHETNPETEMQKMY